MAQLTEPDRSALLERLSGIVGSPNLLVSAPDMQAWLTDWRGRYTGNALAVVMPGSTDEVAAVVRECAARQLAIVPQGGNTGLCGGATPLPGSDSVVIRLARMARIRECDALNNAMTVEAGCTLAAVQEAASAVQRLFPLSLASEGCCQIGGNLSTNAGGVQVLKYGNMRDLTLGLEVVLPDGRIWNGLRGLRKDNTGYDLKSLMIGAEGTLGIITAAVLRLYPQPLASATAWVQVETPAHAVGLLNHVQKVCGDRVSAFELVGKTALELVLRHIPGTRSPLKLVPEWSVLLELSDTGDQAGLNDLLQACLLEASEAGLTGEVALASSVAQAQKLWSLREHISEAQRIEGFSIKHDISVPISRVADFVDQAGALLTRQWPQSRLVIFGHIGDGNLHYNLSACDAENNAALLASSSRINRLVHDLVVGFGGSISAEHGIGQLKRHELQRYKSPVEIEMMCSIKRLLDPLGIMNPGKVLPPQS